MITAPETIEKPSNPPSRLDSLSDRELLIRFLAGDESAFSVIVQRHASLVFRVCRRILHEANDADDAFQATFLVLARKAKSLDWQESIAGWLHQTARRTSLKLRTSKSRRKEVEGRSSKKNSEVIESTTAKNLELRELAEILDAELAALPDRFRDVFLVTQVEGLTRDEAAKRLGITVATVKDRLERGREQLRLRLVRRGITLTSAMLAAWLIPESVQAASLTALATTTSQAATAFAAGSLAAGSVPVASNLAQGVLQMMGFEKLKYITAMVLTIVTAGGIAYGMLQDEPSRFEKGLRGHVVAVNLGETNSVTVLIDEFSTMLSLDLSPQAQVWTAFEVGDLNDLKEGQFVSLRLADDHRTVNEIHVQGLIRAASIKSVTPSGKIIVVEDTDNEEEEQNSIEVELAPNAILRIGGLPANRDDLKPGMQVPLEFGRNGKVVNAIEAEAAENSIVAGTLMEFDADGNKLIFVNEQDENGEDIRQEFAIDSGVMITLDGLPAKLCDLKKDSLLTIRLSEDGQSIRAIKANSPEPCEPAEEPVEQTE